MVFSEREIVVLFGGNGGERLVSVASAQHLAEYFPNAHYWFWAMDGVVSVISRQSLLEHKDPFRTPFQPQSCAQRWSNWEAAIASLENRNTVVLLALHGGDGENGTVQRVLEKHRVAFTGSGSEASATAFDKKLAKECLQQVGAKTAQQYCFTKGEAQSLPELQSFLSSFKKIIVKPVADGSSVGLAILQDSALLHSWWNDGTKSGTRFIAEEFISGRELTVGVSDGPQGPQALACSEVELDRGAQFNYEGKYLGVGSREITPAKLNSTQEEMAKHLAITAHQATGCFGYTRTDIILTEADCYFLEINTLPGLTRASFIPQQVNAAGRSMKDFIDEQLELAIKRG